MRGWSFPLGRWMGVELRIHTFFILLLGVCMAYTESVHLSMFRGMGLWLVLLGAVAVREVARMIVAAYHGLQLRNILLLPIGGLVAYANAESAEAAGVRKVQWRMAVTGPLANLSFALVVAMLVLGMSPTLQLFRTALDYPRAPHSQHRMAQCFSRRSESAARLSPGWRQGRAWRRRPHAGQGAGIASGDGTGSDPRHGCDHRRVGVDERVAAVGGILYPDRRPA